MKALSWDRRGFVSPLSTFAAMVPSRGVPVRVYKYGLLPPVSHAQEIRDLLFTAHRYANTLTAIEQERRKAIRAVLGVELQDAETKAAIVKEQLSASARAIKAHHTAERTLKTPDNLAERYRSLKADYRDAVANFREMKRDLYASPAIKRALEDVKARFAATKREARRASGLAPHSWGTYQRVEAAASQSQAMPLYDGTEPNDPKFKRYRGEGSIAIHFQNEDILPIERFFKANKRAYVEPVDPRAFLPETPRGDRRRLSRTKLFVRLGATDARVPILAEFPMTMHRPIPPGSLITWVVVHLHRYGPREEWTVSVTVSLPDAKPIPSAARGKGAVAVDLGWRVIPGTQELRVCSYYGQDRHAGELRIPSKVLQALGELPDGIRSVRDKNSDAARAALIENLANCDVPEWLATETQGLSRWRSPARLARLTHLWRDARFAGDEGAYGGLEAWRYRDQHLWQYEAGQRRAALRTRREIYRRFAAAMATRYETVVFEDFDLRRVSRRPKTTETDKRANDTARENRVLAATSELRACILNAFTSRGGTSVKVAPFDSTFICHRCGAVEVYDAAAHITHVCSGCGEEWDQDENACRVLLERFQAEEKERGSDGGCETQGRVVSEGSAQGGGKRKGRTAGAFAWRREGKGQPE